MGRAVANKVCDRTTAFRNGQARPAMKPVLALDRRVWSHRMSGAGEAGLNVAGGLTA